MKLSFKNIFGQFLIKESIEIDPTPETVQSKSPLYLLTLPIQDYAAIYAESEEYTFLLYGSKGLFSYATRDKDEIPEKSITNITIRDFLNIVRKKFPERDMKFDFELYKIISIERSLLYDLVQNIDDKYETLNILKKLIEENRSARVDSFTNFLTRKKQIKEKLESYIDDPNLALQYCRIFEGLVSDHIIDVIADKASTAYAYAMDKDERFPLGEPAILKNSQIAYWYAKNIIKDRWIEAEPIIFKDTEWTYLYTRDVIKGRLKEAEPIILKDPEYAYSYFLNTLLKKETFPELEAILKTNLSIYRRYLSLIKKDPMEAIKKSPKEAYLFALGKTKKFPELEKIIATSAEYAYLYAMDVIKGRFELGEPAIAKEAEWAFKYAKDVIKGKWPLGEEVIKKNRKYLEQYIVRFKS